MRNVPTPMALLIASLIVTTSAGAAPSAPPTDVLVGHSYGGLLSLYNAESHPDRVLGLVLVDPMNPNFVSTMGLDWIQATVPDISDPTTPLEHVVVRMKTTFGELVRRTADGLPSIDVPLIVITAGRPWWDDPTADAAWRHSHEELATGSRRELVVANESEHDIPATEPELVVNAIQRVLERIDRE